MMRTPPPTPWHRASFEDFLQHRLPALLRERMGLTSVHAERIDDAACRIVLAGHGVGDPFEIEYAPIPQPDAEGVFHIDDEELLAENRRRGEGPPSRPPNPSASGPVAVAPTSGGQVFAGGGHQLIVSPRADGEDLATARIDCVGELLHAFIEARLGHLPEGVDLDETLVRRLLPLTEWVRLFLACTAQRLNGTNALDRATHLRRLLVLERKEVFTPGHFGRTCPFETPEGPNIGRVLTISRGADIRNGRLVIVDDTPLAGLGLGAASVPFLEHDDGNRVLMGANMMRQWLPPTQTEPAWVQTGLEPDGFWCGRNLLTAFVSWDGYAYDDGLVISESAARKLACPEALEVGDKLSNRHGIKGVVSRVLAEEDMPRLPDGTTVELVFSVCGVPSRWTVGQLREAALSHVAQRRNEPVEVTPFGAPSDESLRQQLRDAGLPEDGLWQLMDGEVTLLRASAAGWVYWGCTHHLVRHKVWSSTRPEEGGQRVGVMEIEALREAGAAVMIRELTNTCSVERADAGELAARAAAGPIAAATTPSPRFLALAKGLAGAGIHAEVGAEGVTFNAAPTGVPTLTLARGVAHPWLAGEELLELRAPEDEAGFAAVAEGNRRLARLLQDCAPQQLIDQAHEVVVRAVAELYDGLVSPEGLRQGSWAQFSGRSVIVPGPELAPDRLGLPEAMAWDLFSPWVSRRLGDRGAVQARSKAATRVLAEVMDGAWIVLNRAPSVSPTSLIAFRPVMSPDKAIRLPLFACRLMDADFDGDQAAVFLPLTEGAQREAGERLSLAGHLRRDPDLVSEVFPGMDAQFGLACLSRSAEGRAAVGTAVGTEPPPGGKILTKHGVTALLRMRLVEDGPEAALAAAAALARLGFEAARREGGSIGPFIGATLQLPERPATAAADHWEAYMEELWALMAGWRDYDDADIGVACLLSHSGARATAQQLSTLVGPGGLVRDLDGSVWPTTHSYREGHTPREVLGRVVGARRGLHRALLQMASLGGPHEVTPNPSQFGVLSRARRCSRPGVVFARAARQQEADPLTDEFARLYVGLPT